MINGLKVLSFYGIFLGDEMEDSVVGNESDITESSAQKRHKLSFLIVWQVSTS